MLLLPQQRLLSILLQHWSILFLHSVHFPNSQLLTTLKACTLLNIEMRLADWL